MTLQTPHTTNLQSSHSQERLHATCDHSSHPNPNLPPADTCRIERVETPAQRQRRETRARTLKTQQAHLRDRLRRRLQTAEQRGDAQLIRQLRREWDELFPNAPSINH